MLADKALSSETDIRIRFNNLCRQFGKNAKYLQANLGEKEYYISEDEDISYEMTVNNKRFEAAYYQMSHVDGFDTMSSEEKAKIYDAVTKNQYGL